MYTQFIKKSCFYKSYGGFCFFFLPMSYLVFIFGGARLLAVPVTAPPVAGTGGRLLGLWRPSGVVA